MYIKYKLSDFVYDFVHAKICTCTKVYYSFIRKCTADIGHRTLHRFDPNFYLISTCPIFGLKVFTVVYCGMFMAFFLQ